MSNYIQILIFVTIGIVLLWFGYRLIMGQWTKARTNWKIKALVRSGKGTSTPGEPQVCPICSSKLERSDYVKTHAFPSITGGKDRLMHIRGCMFCMEGNLERNCPVCNATLADEEFLVARLFERPRRRAHVHVIGCNHCRLKFSPQ